MLKFKICLELLKIDTNFAAPFVLCQKINNNEIIHDK